MAKTVKKRTTKKIADPVAPEVPETPSPVSVEPVAPPEPVEVVADGVGGPESAEPMAEYATPHETPKPTFVLLEGDRYRETKFEHARTVTINGVRYEHTAEDAEGHWIYARS